MELIFMSEEFNELLYHQVALGAALAKAGKLQEFIEIRRKLEDLKNQSHAEKLKGKGLKYYVELFKDSPWVVDWHVVTDERLLSSWKSCPWWEIAKKLGMDEIPLCEGICKAITDSELKLMAPGCSKKIVKSLWWGDEECRWDIRKW